MRRKVEQAVQPYASLVLCRSWEDLRTRLAETSPRARVVVDPLGSAPDGQAVAPPLERLLREFPSTRILAVLDSGRVAVEVVLRLGRIGVADVLDLRTSLNPRAIRAHLDQIPPDAFRTLLDGSKMADLSGRGRLLLERAADLAARGEYPRDLAEALGMSPMTLRRWMNGAGLPTPRHLFRWLRILLASSLLDDPGRTVRDVALAAGYSNASGLRRATNAVLDMPPSELRERGAYRTALRHFLRDPALAGVGDADDA